MSRRRAFWPEHLAPASLLVAADPTGPATLAAPEGAGPRSVRDWVADGAGFVVSVALGVLILVSAVSADADPLTPAQTVVDAACGALACLSLWWRRRWPLGVALVSTLLGTFSSSATVAGLLAVFTLAVHRGGRTVLAVAALWVPTAAVYAEFSDRNSTLAVVLTAVVLVTAAGAWGMYARARSQLLLTLRERAVRAEQDQRMQADRARLAERARIAREMHDVLAHRISLVALHAGGLALRPDLPPEVVRETAELLRSTARQALEELRGVIGVLREEPGQDESPAAPQPRLTDIPRLVEESRRAGTKIELDMQVQDPQAAPDALGRDAYRVVQEALTNIAKHAPGTTGLVRIAGARGDGLRVSVRNRLPVHAHASPGLPGAGSGLLGLAERVALAGGTLVHGPDPAGDFVVEVELPW